MRALTYILTLIALIVPTTAFSDSLAMITPQEAHEQWKTGRAVIVDVRNEDEVRQGMAEPATWLALPDIEGGTTKYENFIQGVRPEQRVILYCRSGRRSETAARIIAKRGLEVANMGAYDAWKSAGLPVRTGP